MLINYIQAAMNQAIIEYDAGDGLWYGEIPACRGVIGVGETEAECRQDTQEALESWLVHRIHEHLSLPVIDGVDLSIKEPA